MKQAQDDSLINSIIDEVMEPQLRQVVIEAWRDVADVDRSKQVKKVTDITCILPSPSPPPPLSILDYRTLFLGIFSPKTDQKVVF